MGDKATYAVQVDKSSDLYEEFEEYKSRGGFTSTSEALRHVIREEIGDTGGSTGRWSKISKIAGEELRLQLQLLGWFVVFIAVSLAAYDFGVTGGVLWWIPAAFFGVFAVSTLVGVLTGVAEVLNPSGVKSPSSSGDPDEVEA